MPYLQLSCANCSSFLENARRENFENVNNLTLKLLLGDSVPIIFFIIIIIIIKKDWQCNAGRGRLTPYQSEDPSPTLPTYRRKEAN